MDDQLKEYLERKAKHERDTNRLVVLTHLVLLPIGPLVHYFFK